MKMTKLSVLLLLTMVLMSLSACATASVSETNTGTKTETKMVEEKNTNKTEAKPILTELPEIRVLQVSQTDGVFSTELLPSGEYPEPEEKKELELYGQTIDLHHTDSHQFVLEPAHFYESDDKSVQAVYFAKTGKLAQFTMDGSRIPGGINCSTEEEFRLQALQFADTFFGETDLTEYQYNVQTLLHITGSGYAYGDTRDGFYTPESDSEKVTGRWAVFTRENNQFKTGDSYYIMVNFHLSDPALRQKTSITIRFSPYDFSEISNEPINMDGLHAAIEKYLKDAYDKRSSTLISWENRDEYLAYDGAEPYLYLAASVKYCPKEKNTEENAIEELLELAIYSDELKALLP